MGLAGISQPPSAPPLREVELRERHAVRAGGGAERGTGWVGRCPWERGAFVRRPLHNHHHWERGAFVRRPLHSHHHWAAAPTRSGMVSF